VVISSFFVQMQLFIEDKDALQKHVDGLQEKIEELEKAYKKARLSKKAQWGLVGVLFTGTVRFHLPPDHQKKSTSPPNHQSYPCTQLLEPTPNDCKNR